MVNKFGRPSRKTALLTAAAEVVAESGIQALTIENVAERAKVTKGGVQYHFESKDLLIAALLKSILEAFDQALESEAGKSRDQKGAWTRAYIRLSLDQSSNQDRVIRTILAGLPWDDDRAEPFRQYVKRWRERSRADGIDPVIATIIRLATDSLWFDRVYGEAPAPELALIREKLLSLVLTA